MGIPTQCFVQTSYIKSYRIVEISHKRPIETKNEVFFLEIASTQIKGNFQESFMIFFGLVLGFFPDPLRFPLESRDEATSSIK